MPASNTEIPEKDRKRDKYLRKNYRIGIDTYNRIGETQGWRCGACGRHASEFTVSLNVDHKHFRIDLERHPTGGWCASTKIRNRVLFGYGKTQKAARENLKNRALPLSIRGLLCPGRYTGCNRLLGRVDRLDWLKQVIAYLENPPALKIIS